MVFHFNFFAKANCSNFIFQAIVFDGEGPAYTAVMEGVVKPGQVMVIRYEGPKGRWVKAHMIICREKFLFSQISDSHYRCT